MTGTDHQSALDGVLRKIGRNMLAFQRMEAMLKFLISRSRLDGTVESLRANHEKAVEAVSRQTMGALVKGFVSSVYGSAEEKASFEEEIDEVWFSFSLKVEASPEEIKQRRATLNSIVEERNVLVHQMLGQFGQTSIESCQAFGARLDAQAEKIRPAYEALRSLVIAVKEGREAAVSAMAEHLERSGK